MRSTRIGVLVAGMIALSPAVVVGQLQTARGLLLPLPDSTAARGVMSRAHYWLEFQRASNPLEAYTAWDYKLGAVVELYRWKRGLAIATQLAHELYATPDNAVGFDPRGAVWEEQLALLGRLGAFQWWASTFVRCRHEVDNGTPPSVAEGRSDTQPTSRIVVLPGSQLAVSTRDLAFGERFTLRVGASGEAYAGPEDRRNPRTRQTPRWSDATGSAALTGRIGARLTSAIDGYARVWQSTVFFRDGSENTRSNSEAELGLHIRGRSGAIDVYVSRERTFDDVTLPTPRPHAGTYFGVRLASRSVF